MSQLTVYGILSDLSFLHLVKQRLISHYWKYQALKGHFSTMPSISNAFFV